MSAVTQASVNAALTVVDDTIQFKENTQSFTGGCTMKGGPASSAEIDNSTVVNNDNGTISSPAGLGIGLSDLSFANEDRIDVSSSPDGMYMSMGTQHNGYTPCSGRRSHGHQGFSNSSSSFIQRGDQAKNDDPFANTPSRGSQTYHCSNRRRSGGPSPSSAACASTNWRTNSSCSGGSLKQVNRKLFHDGKSKSPEGGAIDSKNAQAIFPPSACVFVANLLQTEDEEQLEYAVTKVFKDYGHVFVKIRRDGKNMPFAFCQFTTDEAAARAVEAGRGRIIHGRPCRTERARANRLYTLTRRNGKGVTIDEARDLASRYGEIEEITQITEVEQMTYNHDSGCFIKFKYYENGRDAAAALRDHTDFYIVQQTHGALPSTKIDSTRKPTSSEAKMYLDRYDVDRRSIFVGNLPQSADNNQLKDRFERFGAVRNADVIRRRSNREGCLENVFGFVEFFDPTAVQQAQAEEHNAIFGGSRLRVVPKNSDNNASRDHRPIRDAKIERSNKIYSSPPQVVAVESSITPQYYSSPYGFMTGYPPTPMYSSGYNGYAQTPTQYASGYSPAAYFTGSPRYQSCTLGHGDVALSPSPSAFYQYSGYQYPAGEYYAPQVTNGYQMGYPSPYAPIQAYQGQYAETAASENLSGDISYDILPAQHTGEVSTNEEASQ